MSCETFFVFFILSLVSALEKRGRALFAGEEVALSICFGGRTRSFSFSLALDLILLYLYMRGNSRGTT